MKFTSRFLRAILAIALLGLLFATHLQAQVTPTTTVPIFATNVIVFSHTSSNLTAAQKYTNTVRQGLNFAVAPQFVGGTSTNTGTLAIQFDIGYSNGTLVTTTLPLSVRSTANGTTWVRDWVVLSASNIGPADRIITSVVTNGVANGTSTITVSNVLGQWQNP